MSPSFSTPPILRAFRRSKKQEARSQRQETRLFQNRPNPFGAGGTAIQFKVQNANCKMSLKIYDVAGGLVRTLIHNEPVSNFPPEADSPQANQFRVSVVWDGTDRSGNDVAAGVYFYRLTVHPEQGPGVGSFTATRKMVVLR